MPLPPGGTGLWLDEQQLWLVSELGIDPDTLVPDLPSLCQTKGVWGPTGGGVLLHRNGSALGVALDPLTSFPPSLIAPLTLPFSL